MSGAAKPLLDAREARLQISDGERQIIALLTEIRDALVLPTGEPECPHPDEARIEMSSMGETEWQCRLCKFHYGPVRRTS